MVLRWRYLAALVPKVRSHLYPHPERMAVPAADEHCVAEHDDSGRLCFQENGLHRESVGPRQMAKHLRPEFDSDSVRVVGVVGLTAQRDKAPLVVDGVERENPLQLGERVGRPWGVLHTREGEDVSRADTLCRIWRQYQPFVHLRSGTVATEQGHGHGSLRRRLTSRLGE